MYKEINSNNKEFLEKYIANKSSIYSKFDCDSLSSRLDSQENRSQNSIKGSNTPQTGTMTFGRLRSVDFSRRRFFILMTLPDRLFLRSCFIRYFNRELSEVEEENIILAYGGKIRKGAFLRIIINSEEFAVKNSTKLFRRKKKIRGWHRLAN